MKEENQSPQEQNKEAASPHKNLAMATFAGGCFWCMEPPFKTMKGVREVTPGYTGGETKDPTYNEVSTGTTGHLEAVQIVYDPEKVSYEELLERYWQQIDPTDPGGQFVDRGSQYRTAIFYHNERQKTLAKQSKKELANSGKFEAPIVTEIRPFETFYPAETYHHEYYKKKPKKYKRYKRGSGREQFKKEKWESSNEK